MGTRGGGGGAVAVARALPVRARRAATAAAAFLLLGTAAIGALHTSWGRPLLARLGGCPAMRVSAAEVDGLRRRGVSGIRGARPAPSRPALGFVLDGTTEAGVRAWAARAGLSCAAQKRGLVTLHCPRVPRTVLPEAAGDRAERSGGSLEPGAPAVIEDLALAFGLQGRLVSVDAFTRGLPAAEAAAAFSSSDARLGALLGPPTDRAGESPVAALARAPLTTSRHRYRFSDYVAIVSVTNLSSGLAVREQYLSGS